MRKYMSKRQRPCDFCRSRKTACRIDNTPPCRSCQLHAKDCTFVETPKPRRRPAQTPGQPSGFSSVNTSSSYHASGLTRPSNALYVPVAGGSQGEAQGASPEQLDILPSPDLSMQFLNDIDLDGSEYHFMFRTPRSPSRVTHDPASLPPTILSIPPRIVLDVPGMSTCPENLGLSGDMDPFLLRRYRTDDSGTFKFKQLSIQSVQQAPLPVYFLSSHSSLFERSRTEAGHESLADERLREDLEATISQSMGQRLISLYQKFIATQYPIFSANQTPNPTDSSPSLLAAIYSVTFSFAKYDDRLCIDLAYESPPYETLSRIIDLSIAANLHSPNLELVQLLLLNTIKPSADPHISDSSYRWSMLSMLVAAAVNVGLHLDPLSWNILPWQISQRRRISFSIYAIDKWLAASLGRPPHINEANWLITSLRNEDELGSDLPEVRWKELMDYSSLTSVIARTITDLYSLRATHQILQDPERGVAIADAVLSTSIMENLRLTYQKPVSSGHSMLKAILCLGYHYTTLLITRASIHPFLSTDRTSPAFRSRHGKIQHAITTFCAYLESLRTDDVNGFWPPWCQAAFSSLCFSQLLMASHAPTEDDARFWVEQLHQTRMQLRIKSNSLPILRLGLLRIDSIFWRGIDQVLDLEAHVSQAFRNAQN